VDEDTKASCKISRPLSGGGSCGVVMVMMIGTVTKPLMIRMKTNEVGRRVREEDEMLNKRLTSENR
jgi:hypothetical protein